LNKTHPQGKVNEVERDSGARSEFITCSPTISPFTGEGGAHLTEVKHRKYYALASIRRA